MADKVVLHVGLMKSGTTFLQRQLFAHQSTLRDRGTLVPGTKWGDQVTAVSDGLRRDGNHDGSGTPSARRSTTGAATPSCPWSSSVRPARG